MPDKPNITLPGTVEKIIPSPHPNESEKAQIAVKDADELYKEIRIENALRDAGKSTRPRDPVFLAPAAESTPP